jgi:hypothetical protein
MTRGSPAGCMRLTRLRLRLRLRFWLRLRHWHCRSHNRSRSLRIRVAGILLDHVQDHARAAGILPDVTEKNCRLSSRRRRADVHADFLDHCRPRLLRLRRATALARCSSATLCLPSRWVCELCTGTGPWNSRGPTDRHPTALPQIGVARYGSWRWLMLLSTVYDYIHYSMMRVNRSKWLLLSILSILRT